MFRIPTVLFAQEILDKVFHKASKVKIDEKGRMPRWKRLSISKLYAMRDSLDATLGKYVKKFPSFNNLPLFYQELIDVLAGVDQLKHSLGALDWARTNTAQIINEGIRKVKHTDSKTECEKIVKSVYGRVSSVVNRIAGELEFLNEARESLRKLPVVDPEIPTIVIAGYPNVGKSLLVKRISTAKPEVDTYPFTTKGITVGMFERGYDRYQVIDTPGLLDRPLEKRNDIELQAAMALRHLAQAVVFILDPSEYCGYPLEAQKHLLESLRKEFEGVPFLVVDNKVDIVKGKDGNLGISAETGEGVKEMVERIVEMIPAQPSPPEEFTDKP